MAESSRVRAPVILGVDLSPSGTGLVVVRAPSRSFAIEGVANGDFSRVDMALLGERLVKPTVGAVLDRLDNIATQVVRFALAHEVTHAFVENYSFGMKFNSHQLGELGGVVKLALHRSGLTPIPVASSSARKLLLGKNVKGAKKIVEQQLKKSGFTGNGDQCDALAVANYGLAALGYKALTFSEGGTR
jgi:Holliday junction resolvasome RuvABC endonuclease subunit